MDYNNSTQINLKINSQDTLVYVFGNQPVEGGVILKKNASSNFITEKNALTIDNKGIYFRYLSKEKFLGKDFAIFEYNYSNGSSDFGKDMIRINIEVNNR